MSELYHTETTPQLICWDRKYYNNFEDQLTALKHSRTLYVGNLSFFTTEAQILETFSTVGPVQRVIMGLNNLTKNPCGFCFVEYYNQEHSKAALKYVSDTVCDDRVIRCDADGGFKPGRQYGRGKSGGQIRDERSTNVDVSRGGLVAPSVLGKSKRGRDDDEEEGKPTMIDKLATGLSTARR
jgi:nuclear cap-binding protein subunit 2